MKNKKGSTTPIILFAGFLLTWVALGCGGNPFAPEKHTPKEDTTEQPAPAANKPEQLIDNLHRAMRDRDKDLYETLLDSSFWFTEADCAGELVWANGMEEELAFIGGSRDGSDQGIFDIFRTFEFDFTLHPNGRSTELGRDYPKAYDTDPDGHPDEDWEVFRGRVQMLMIDDKGDGFRVDQVMTYKLREDEAGLWKIIRWIDDPLSGDCGTGKPVAGFFSWAAVKRQF